MATDVSAKALATARAAAYERRQVERGLSSRQIHKYFEHCGDHWVARPALRKLVEFRRVNLVQPFGSLGTFEVILCRNVLIYFDDATRRKICDQFFAMLADGGWLLLGSAENLYGISDRFTSVRLGDTLAARIRAHSVDYTKSERDVVIELGRDARGPVMRTVGEVPVADAETSEASP